MDGGVGNDLLYGDDGNDKIFGNNGSDRMFGGTGRDNLLGGDGDDTLSGEHGNDLLIGEGGNDNLDGGGDFDRVCAIANANFTITDSSIDSSVTGTDQIANIDLIQIDGGSGNNRIDAIGATIPVSLFGGAGDDTLIGGSGADVLIGDAGDDLLVGRGGVDTLLGTPENDREYQDDAPQGNSNPAIIIDDGDADYSTVGFLRATDGGHLGDYEYGGVGIGSGATWKFTGLTSGASYDVSTTWVVHPNRATDAPYRINGSAPARVNQELAPNDLVDAGTSWKRLGIFVADRSGVLEVILAVDADEFVIADAVRIQKLASGSGGERLSNLLVDGFFGNNAEADWDDRH